MTGGWIAPRPESPAAAHVILIPETPFTVEHVCRLHRRARRERARPFTIVVVAEGEAPPELKENRRVSACSPILIGTIGIGANKEVRISVLAHSARRYTHTVRSDPGPRDFRRSRRRPDRRREVLAGCWVGAARRIDCLKRRSSRFWPPVSVDLNGELVRAARAIGIRIRRLTTEDWGPPRR